MVLSIIIVNYNVKYFAEQCLCSVKKAIANLSLLHGENEVEVFMVDNNSFDDSIAYLQPKFPFVQFISNKENVGFAKANNQALQIARGEYVLFLNPDTIVGEDCFVKCISFMEQNAQAGALGVHMIDGSGRFLKESKRGFPTAWVSFCKMSGLINVFPKSKLFSGYYLGHLNENKNHAIEAIAGAFTLVKKHVLEKTGGFDEQFFMYAEDIDLSYRIRQAGFTNYYLADTSIIHFKGESTKKDIGYVKLFYKAMRQFVQKHYRGNSAWYVSMLNAAIWMKAGLETIGRKQQNNTSTAINIKAFLTGDEKSIAEAEVIANASKRILVENRNEANEIILCEGDQFSFVEMIKAMQQSPGKKYKMHSAGSGSIAGSYDSNTQGEVMLLNH